MAGPAPCDLGPGAPLLPVGPIVDVLKYSQKNLDSVVEATQKENKVLWGKCAALQERLLEMGKIMDSFEGTVYQVMEESQKQKELAKAEMQKVLKERAQLTADLHSMEKSFSDLFKRFEKQKEVIEGYRTVGAGPAWGPGRGGGPAGGGAEHSPGAEPGKKREAGQQVGPGSALPLPAPWALGLSPATGHGAREASVWACAETAGLCWLLCCPHRHAAGHPAPRARGSGNETGCSRAWCLSQVPPQCLDRAPVAGP